MADTTDQKIIAQCAIAYPTHNTDCNAYLKEVSNVFFEPDLFSGANMNADKIISTLNSDPKWEKVGKEYKSAVDKAKAGKFVIAGMTSTELSSDHGHVAVIISDDMQVSGTIPVPICYAGSLSPGARVARKRISGTFGVTPAREKKISYFARFVDTVPKASGFDMMTNYLRGDRGDIELIPAGKPPRSKSNKPKAPTKTDRKK